MGVPVFVADIKGDLSGLLSPVSPTTRSRTCAASSGSSGAERPSGLVPLASAGSAPACRCAPRCVVRAPASRQGARRQRDAVVVALPGLRLRRPAGLALSISTTCGRCCSSSPAPGQGRAPGHRRTVVGHRRRAAPQDHRARPAGRGGVLRRAGVRHRRPHADHHRRQGCHQLPRAEAVQDKPRLFSTFLMWLLADLFQTLPEIGDVEQPKLVLLLRRGTPPLRGRAQGVRWPGAQTCGSSGRRASACSS